MKKLFPTIVLVFSLLALNLTFAQTFIDEDFSSGVFPPAGWTIDNHAENWQENGSNKAGGMAPEARLYWDPLFTGVSRFITPEMNTTGVTSVGIEFKSYINHWSSSFLVGVATRSGGGDWTTVWEKNVTDDETGTFYWISTSDNVGASDFQVCFYFDGNTGNLLSWNLDDISIYVNYEHDVKVESITIPSPVSPQTTFAPEASVRNIGNSAESFDVQCKIYEYGNVVYSDAQTVSSLGSGDAVDVVFTDFTPPDADVEYVCEVTTLLEPDMNNDNDQKTKTFSTAVRDRIVLWEQFTNTGCGPCASANPTIEQMLANNGEDVVIAVWAHVWWPSSSDPYYVANTTDNAARTSYYGVNAVPDSFTDGVLEPSPGNMTSMQNAVDERHNTPSIIDLQAQYDDSYKLRVEYTVVNTIPSGNYKLRVVVVENDLYFNAPNGETHFDHVLRKYYPDANGTSIDLAAKGDHDILYFDLTMDATWNLDNIEIFAFIQDDVMKEVAQAAKATYSQYVPVELTTFNAIAEGNNVTLSWETATESNNNGFEVERTVVNNSANTASPENLNWEKIGFVEGKGTSSQSNIYKFSDDISALTGQTIAYRLKQIDFDGTYSYSQTVEVENILPSKFELSQNYPNPFNPTTTIAYQLPFDSKVELKVYDLLGNLVATVVNEKQSAGSHKVKFSSSKLTSGVYFYRMTAGGFTKTKKMTVLK